MTEPTINESLRALGAWAETVEEWRTQHARDVSAFQESMGAQMVGMATHLQSLTAHIEKQARDVTAFQESASNRIEILTEQMQALTTDLQNLLNAIYAIPYTSEPSAVMTTNESHRAQIGYRNVSSSQTRGYRSFEDVFRGPEAFIRDRQRLYLDVIGGHAPVLDIGCGRGEFLELLTEAHIPATGIDPDLAMVARCREKRLPIVQADAISYLGEQTDDTIGAIFAAQVIEHLPYEEFMTFLDLAHRKLMPGGLLIAETINPHSIAAFKTFWVDLTHRSPIFPEVAVELCRIHGFDSAVVIFPLGTGDLDRDRRTEGEYAVIATKHAPDTLHG